MIAELKTYRVHCDVCGLACPATRLQTTEHGAELDARVAQWSKYGTEHVCPACDLNQVDVAPELAVLAGLQAPEPFAGLGPVDAALVVDVDLTAEQRRQLAELGEEARR